MLPSDLGITHVPNWRSGQLEAIQRACVSGYRFTGQCMPTGWGKSVALIAEALSMGKRALILTSSKALQEQYAKEFSYLRMPKVQGKMNYVCKATEPNGEFYDGTIARSVADGPCHFDEECSLRYFGCTYYDEVRAAKYRPLVNANYAAWISANLYTEGWGQFDVVACDEAHEIEDWLARMLAVRLPRCYNKLMSAKIPNTTNVAVWTQWADRELPLVKAAIRLEKKARKKRLSKIRVLQQLEGSLTRLRTMTHEWRIFPENDHILFQPVWVHEYTEPLIFGGASKVVLASSTMVPNTMHLLGILPGEMDFYSYPSTFPPSRRPIYYKPVVKMRHGMSEEEEKRWIAVVDEFISQRLDRKGIIHTVSYARQQLLLKHSRYASLMVAASPSSMQTGSTSSGNMSLQRFKASPPPCVLTGPKWTTGINLPYTECEYTIIPKVPFSDITDPLHMARMEDNPDQGMYDAGIKLTQSIGRAMRAADDSNETLITDAKFGDFMGPYRRMIADWIWDAVIRVNELPTPLEKL